MSRPLQLSLGVLIIAACVETAAPNQPETGNKLASTAVSAALASNTWTAKAPLASGGFRVSAGVALNSANQAMVYVLGGESMTDEPNFGGLVQAYNLATNTWITRSSRVSVSRTNGVGKVGGKLYFSGGYRGQGKYTAALYAYDYATDRMIRKADMPKYTAEGVTGVIDGKLYVLPGTCSTEHWPDSHYCKQDPIRRLYRYDPATNVWVARLSSPHFHRHGAGGVINGKFYVAGGFNGFQPVVDLDMYDPATNTWTTLAPMPTGGRAIGAALGGRLYVITGVNTPGSGSELRAYVYNPATNLWETRAAPTWSHGTAVRVSLDGKAHLLAVGDSHGFTHDKSNDSELYTP